MPSTRFLRSAAATGAAALVLVFAPALHAQDPAPAPAAEPTEEELRAFAHAYLDIAAISAQAEAELEGVEDGEVVMQIQEQAQEYMVAAVEAQGLTAERYQQIGTAVNTDEELLAQFVVIIEEVQEERTTVP